MLDVRHTVASEVLVLSLVFRVVALITGLEDTSTAGARVSGSLTCSLRHVDLVYLAVWLVIVVCWSLVANVHVVVKGCVELLNMV